MVRKRYQKSMSVLINCGPDSRKRRTPSKTCKFDLINGEAHSNVSGFSDRMLAECYKSILPNFQSDNEPAMWGAIFHQADLGKSTPCVTPALFLQECVNSTNQVCNILNISNLLMFHAPRKTLKLEIYAKKNIIRNNNCVGLIQ